MDDRTIKAKKTNRFIFNPKQNVGQFYFGQNVNDIIDLILDGPIDYGDLTFNYNSNNPYERFYINLIENDLLLGFDGINQNLEEIILVSPKKTELIFNETKFSGSFVSNDIFSIYQLFGPTYSLQYSKADESNNFAEVYLTYPGIMFYFNVPLDSLIKKTEDRDKSKFEANDDVEVAAGTLLLVSCIKMSLDMKPTDSNKEAESQILIHSRGIYFKDKVIRLMDSASKLIALLGSPSNIVGKKDTPNIKGLHLMTNNTNLVYYIYRDLGITFVIQAGNMLVSKIIFHTNTVDHFEFGEYFRCKFRLFVDKNSKQLSCLDDVCFLDAETLSHNFHFINCFSNQKEIADIFGNYWPKPIIHSETFCDAFLFFGYTYFFVTEQLIFQFSYHGNLVSCTLI
eukprot:TRINITY_DN2597_c0_g1_i1.p1 TRINITY_DN2597_c0_g1~~TRINITY_DN2597_c0_g1_i1.p1  ORF type:complete len:397 (+),score=72.98 TRINITY_DN2597_c0_g1_i1:46-1236(+)